MQLPPFLTTSKRYTALNLLPKVVHFMFNCTFNPQFFSRLSSTCPKLFLPGISWKTPSLCLSPGITVEREGGNRNCTFYKATFTPGHMLRIQVCIHLYPLLAVNTFLVSVTNLLPGCRPSVAGMLDTKGY